MKRTGTGDNAPGVRRGPSAAAAAGWLVLAVAGQAASLRMIDAGPILRYQHYRPIGLLAAESPWLLAVFFLQTLFVAFGAWRLIRSAGSETRTLSWVRVTIALALSVVTAATVSPSPLRYVQELSFAAFLQLLNVATIVLMVSAVPRSIVAVLSARLDAAFGAFRQPDSVESDRADWFGWRMGAFATVVAALLAVFSYGRHPHVPDEVVYLYHARYFAQGQLTMPLPPVPAAFEIDLMSYEPTRWFSPVPPGWPAVLTLGVLVGAPWLVNPVLAGLAIVLTYALLRELYSRRLARWATVLLAVSPWFLFLGMSYMTHTLMLVFALTAALGIARARRSGSLAWSLLAGVAVGAVSWIRPLDGLLIGILMALWAMGVGGRRLRIPALAALLVGTVVSGAAIYPYNKALTGNGTTFPINVYTDRLYGPNSNAYGFGKDRGLGWAFDPNPGHSAVDALINANLNTFGINTDLLGWSTGSLVLVALALVMGTLTRADRLMMATIVLIFTGYFFYYFSGGPDFAARYWFPIIVPLAVLSARGLEELERRVGARAPLAVATLVVMSLAIYVPWRAVDKYHNYRGMRPDVRQLAADHGFAGDLVLVAGARFPDYASAAILNPIDLNGGDTVYAWDRNPEVRAATLRAFQNRRVWFIEGPAITKEGYRVTAGPLQAGDLLEGGPR